MYCDVKAKVLQAVNKFVGLLILVAFVKVVRTGIFVECPVFEHVVDGGKDGSGHGSDGFLISAASSDANVLGMKVGPFGPGGGPGALNKSRLQPGGSGLQPVGPALAGALVVFRTEACP